MDWRELQRALVDQGFEVSRTEGNHYQARAPTGGRLVHFSESDEPRAFKNTVGDLRRVGFVWPPPEKERVAPAATFAECPICRERSFDTAAGVCIRCPHPRLQKALGPEPVDTPLGLDEAFAEVKRLRQELKLARDLRAIAEEDLRRHDELRMPLAGAVADAVTGEARLRTELDQARERLMTLTDQEE